MGYHEKLHLMDFENDHENLFILPVPNHPFHNDQTNSDLTVY